MARDFNARVLIRASRNRKVCAPVPSTRRLSIQLGHLIRYHSIERPWNGLVPGRMEWQATFRVDTLDVPRPASGETSVALTCPTCGGLVTVSIRSRRAILGHYLSVTCAAALAGLACYAVCQESGYACWAVIGVLYLLMSGELLGMADHHSAVRIIRQSRPGHQVWRPGDAAAY
jgi:hypothetical protein